MMTSCPWASKDRGDHMQSRRKTTRLLTAVPSWSVRAMRAEVRRIGACVQVAAAPCPDCKSVAKASKVRILHLPPSAKRPVTSGNADHRLFSQSDEIRPDPGSGGHPGAIRAQVWDLRARRSPRERPRGAGFAKLLRAVEAVRASSRRPARFMHSVRSARAGPSRSPGLRHSLVREDADTRSKSASLLAPGWAMAGRRTLASPEVSRAWSL